jgi:lipid-binding SYLF domain-containing protein
MTYTKREALRILALGAAAAGTLGLPHSAVAATARQIDRDAESALTMLYNSNAAAQQLAREASGILVFPRIVKAGLMVGGAYGEGVLRRQGRAVSYYKSVAASFGLQAGGQSFGYALFLMSDKAVAYLNRSDGWEIGVGPSVVIVDDGIARKVTTTTVREEIYAFIFGQKGLMAGLGIEGTKISRIAR